MTTHGEQEAGIWVIIVLFLAVMAAGIYYPVWTQNVWSSLIDLGLNIILFFVAIIPDSIIVWGGLLILTIGLLIMVFVFLRGIYRMIVP